MNNLTDMSDDEFKTQLVDPYGYNACRDKEYCKWCKAFELEAERRGIKIND